MMALVAVLGMDVDLAACDRLDADLLGRTDEGVGPFHPAVVREGAGVVSILSSDSGKLICTNQTVSEAVFRMSVKD